MNILISYIAIGPTYKDRLVSNLQKYPAYKHFDVLITTDDPSYPGFDAIRKLSNVFIDDLNVHRDRYPEFYEVEKIPTEKRSETIYKNEVVNLLKNGFRYSFNLQRFSLLYKDISKYQYLILLDCDTVPLHTENDFLQLEKYLQEMEFNSVSSNRAYYKWPQPEVLSFTEQMNQELNKNVVDFSLIHSFDGPLKLLKFESGEKIQSFFDTWNYCFRSIALENKHSVIIGGSWCILSEILYAITYKLENFKLNLTTNDYLQLKNFKTYTYLEDRFWDNVIHSEQIDTLQETKEDFIKKNFEILKEFYAKTGQEFNY